MSERRALGQTLPKGFSRKKSDYIPQYPVWRRYFVYDGRPNGKAKDLFVRQYGIFLGEQAGFHVSYGDKRVSGEKYTDIHAVYR